MKPKTRAILAHCIETGLDRGYIRAHKHTSTPTEMVMMDEQERAIWMQIDEFFDFEEDPGYSPE
jgi:hypothetical protein